MAARRAVTEGILYHDDDEDSDEPIDLNNLNDEDMELALQ